MTERRVGLWLIGAFGGVGTTVALGLAALRRGLTDSTSLVTALPLFEPLHLDEAAEFVIGGHDIRRANYRQAVKEFQQRSNVFETALVEGCLADLDAWAANVRPGTVLQTGETITRLADWPEGFAHLRTPLETASDAAIAAFEGLRAVQHGNGDLIAVFRALRHALGPLLFRPRHRAWGRWDRIPPGQDSLPSRC